MTGLPSISEATAEDAVSRQPADHEEKGGKPSNSKKGPKGKRKRPNDASDEAGAKPLGPETAVKVLMDLEQIFMNSGGKINKSTAQDMRETISVLVKENAHVNVWLAKAEGRLLERERAGIRGRSAPPWTRKLC